MARLSVHASQSLSILVFEHMASAKNSWVTQCLLEGASRRSGFDSGRP
jgi:hypothetical protein